MKMGVLGGDGYCGWATALYLSAKGHSVAIVDNFIRRQWDHELGAQTLTPILPFSDRLRAWHRLTGQTIDLFVGDVIDYDFLLSTVKQIQPEAIIHFAEQRSAPYSMIDRKHAVFTQVNNVVGTLNLLFAIREVQPDCHLIKLGTMGEYGTPNIDIEEGYINIEHNGRQRCVAVPQTARLFLSPFQSARQPQHDVCLQDLGVRATDLNQGVVYGTMTDEIAMDEALDQPLRLRRSVRHGAEPLLRAGGGRPSFDRLWEGRPDARISGYPRYRSLRRTGLSESRGQGRMPRVQPIHGTVYRAGTGEDGAEAGKKIGLKVEIDHMPDPRVEAEEHYYNAKHSKLIDLGLKPHFLSDSLLDSLMNIAMKYRDRVDTTMILPQVNWRAATQ